MKRRIKYQWAALFIISAFLLLPAIASFADTTAYQYDNANRKIRVASGAIDPATTYSVSGIVTSTGNALAGVTVTLGGVQTVTDSNGYYRFTGLY